MNINEVLNRLEKVKSNGLNKWLARCSCHDDNNPSLSISIADNGKLLLYCFAGCDYSDIARSLGIDSKDYLNEKQLTDNEKRAIKEQREKERAEYQQKRLELARYIWKQSKPLTDATQQPYLIRKQIKGTYGLRLNTYQNETSLIIPFGCNGELKAVQCIDTQGNKKIIGEKAGNYFILNKQVNPAFIAIAEGLATIASIFEDDFIQKQQATTQPFMCVMGIDADNLPKVAEAMRERYPDAEIIIFGDMGDDNQKGEKMARKAASLVRGYVVFPPMAKGDFNDYLTSGVM